MDEEFSPARSASNDILARWTGALFLWLIVSGLGGAAIISQVRGAGEFREIAERISSSEYLYRSALVLELLGAISAILLSAFLFAILARFGRTLALSAVAFRVAEAIVGSVGIIFAFARVGIYTSDPAAPGSLSAEALIDLTRYGGAAAHNISAFCCGVGSLFFFQLFLRSNVLPRALSWIGIFASILVMGVTVGTLISPAYGSYLQYGWAPMAVAEVGAGIWLLIKGAPTAT
jgi:hypothetical protein